MLNRFLLLLDALIVFGGFTLAWYIKFNSGILSYTGHLPFRDYSEAVTFGILAFIFSNWVAGLYKPMRTQQLSNELVGLIKSLFLGMLLFMSALYFVKLVHFSRDVIVLFAIFFLTFSLIERIAMRSVLRFMRSRGFNQKFILLVGWNSAVQVFVEALEGHPWFGYRILGYLESEGVVENTTLSIPKVGTVDQLSIILTQYIVDHVVISLPRQAIESLTEVAASCEAQGIQSLILPDYYGLLPANPRFESIAGMPLIDTRYVPLDDALNAMMKRIFDVLFSLVVLVSLTPVYLIIAIAVKMMSSDGSVFFSQQRVGKNRREFEMYKFRTMVNNNEFNTLEDIEAEWTVLNDPRRTKLGSFLRRTSLDELPQFWNVLVGDMSVIGPRPERPQFVNQFRHEVPKYMVKHRVRPGITGWAQVNGLRGDTSISERISLDVYYIENWSFWFDARIFLLSLVRGFVNENSY